MSKEKQRSFTRERLEFLYITENLSTREVAEKLNESKRVIEYLINQKYKIKKPSQLILKNLIRNRYRSDKWNISKEKINELYIDKNLTQSKIAEMLNVKPSVIKSLLEAYKIHKPSELLSKAQLKVYITKEEFEDLYIKQNLSVKEMCLKLNCSSDTIHSLRKKYGIKKPNDLRIKNFSKKAKGRVSPMKGKKFTDEHKKKISEKLKGNENQAGRIISEKTREKLRKALTGKKHSIESIKRGIETRRKNGTLNTYSLQSKLKEYETKRKRGTFNSSKAEKEILLKLNEKFKDVKYQYRSDLYPFQCDFYIPEENLYIEYQGSWTHGFKPYEQKNLDCIAQLIKWKEKINSSSYYRNAIKVWTKTDPLKRKVAKENGLNWIEFFTMNEFMQWYNKQ